MKLSALLPADFYKTCPDIDIQTVTPDSREVVPGTLFFALSGTKHEGSDFIKDAIAKGAAAIITEKEILPLSGLSVPVFYLKEAAALLGTCAYKLAAPLPKHLSAITGTNGKTSTADFLRQIWALDGKKSASIGTLGIRTSIGHLNGSHTTPPPTFLAKYLHQLKEKAIDYVALEASSHGLAQNRLAGLLCEAAGFTSFSRDHLDYHKNTEAYLAAKLILFQKLRQKNAPIVAATACGENVLQELEKIAQQTQSPFRTVGKGGNFFNLLETRPLPHGQDLIISVKGGKTLCVHLPVPGLFQAQNALLAAALACPATVQSHEEEALRLLNFLPQLKPIPGRAELAGKTENGASVYIDYAHTPDAIERIIESLRPHLGEKGKLVLVFGAGGNRDSGKRPLMGKAASLADFPIVTDDNPRFENPAAIRQEILISCPEAVEIADRKQAIRYGLQQLKEGDILLIAGKGHEKGQEIKGEIHPFDDLRIAQQEGNLQQERQNA